MRDLAVPLARQLARDLPITIIDRVAAFVASSLFANNEGGAVYDIADTTSLRVGRDGSGGVPNVGDPVRFVMDKRKMGRKTAAQFIASQPELSPFTGGADTGYSNVGVSTSFTGGVLTVVASSGASDRIEISLSDLTAGDHYSVIIRARQTIGTAARIQSWTWATVTTTAFTSEFADYEFILPATSTSGLIRIYASNGTGSAGDTIEISSVSVQSIPGNHLVAPSDAARPVYQTSGGLHYLDFDSVDDALEAVNLTGLSATSSLVIAARSNTGQYIFHAGSTSTTYIGVASDGDTDTRIYFSAGSPSIRKNGATWVPANRDEFHDDLNGSDCVVTFETTDLTNAGWQGFGIGNYTNYEFGGRWYGTVLIDRALTAEERTNVETLLATRSGATLA
jgi:hypothetical protein